MDEKLRQALDEAQASINVNCLTASVSIRFPTAISPASDDPASEMKEITKQIRDVLISENVQTSGSFDGKEFILRFKASESDISALRTNLNNLGVEVASTTTQECLIGTNNKSRSSVTI